jgi:hypothetical protein
LSNRVSTGDLSKVALEQVRLACNLDKTILTEVCLLEDGVLLEFSANTYLCQELLGESNGENLEPIQEVSLLNTTKEFLSTFSIAPSLRLLDRMTKIVLRHPRLDARKTDELKKLVDKITDQATTMSLHDDPNIVDLYRKASTLFKAASLKSPNEDFRNDATLLSKMWKGIADYEERRQRHKHFLGA